MRHSHAVRAVPADTTDAIALPLEPFLSQSAGVRVRLDAPADAPRESEPHKLIGVFNGSLKHLLMVAICAHLFLACGGRQGVQTQVLEHPREAAAPYVMAADDVIEVVVWKQPEISGRLVIAQDGSINVPLAGRVHAAGMTTDQLQKELTRRLSAFIEGPTVTVRVADARSQAVYIIGEVKKPGVFRLHPGEVLSQALAEAQGFTEFAELSSIRIARRTATQTEQITVNYNLVQSGRDLSADVPLMAGDVVHVP